MLIPAKEKFDKPDFVIYNCGAIPLRIYTNTMNQIENKLKDNSLDDTLVAINFTSMEMIIFGTEYAGEMKKGVLTLMMYLMPLKNNLCLHSSANVDRNNKENVSLFFGLSGTGKTSLSADPRRFLIGDDEHVWTPDGLFNVEGGCYAKCIGLKESSEPEIFNAIRYGAVVENVVHTKNTNIIDFDDTSITKNTRCAYPLEHIPNTIIPAKVDTHPNNIILLTCDAFGVLPPVAQLTPEQAIYFFVNGYTSKVAGTEVGIEEPEATFSACFGEPFLVWNPLRYGELLKEKVVQHNATIWMLNTGWIRGGYGVGHRISIKDTRCLLDNINNGELIKKRYAPFPLFNLAIPTSCPGVDPEILNPMNVWEDKDKYMEVLSDLHNKFEKNYKNKLKYGKSKL
jgi:phosphoenolpyruvate carboxykinase (ATP)